MNPGFRSAIGIELTDLTAVGCVLRFDGSVVYETRRELKALDMDHVWKAAVSVAETLVPVAQGYGPVLGIGIGSQGVVSNGSINSFPGNMEWQPLPLAQRLAEHMRVPCRMELRLLTATVGELLFGKRYGYDGPVIYFISGPGSGFGVGLITQGVVLRGAGGLQGQFGHVRISDQEKRCHCGNHGCLVAFTAPTAVVAQASEALRNTEVESSLRHCRQLRFPDIVTAALAEDGFSVRLIEDAAERLGLGMSYLITC